MNEQYEVEYANSKTFVKEVERKVVETRRLVENRSAEVEKRIRLLDEAKEKLERYESRCEDMQGPLEVLVDEYSAMVKYYDNVPDENTDFEEFVKYSVARSKWDNARADISRRYHGK